MARADLRAEAGEVVPILVINGGVKEEKWVVRWGEICGLLGSGVEVGVIR